MKGSFSRMSKGWFFGSYFLLGGYLVGLRAGSGAGGSVLLEGLISGDG